MARSAALYAELAAYLMDEACRRVGAVARGPRAEMGGTMPNCRVQPGEKVNGASDAGERKA